MENTTGHDGHSHEGPCSRCRTLWRLACCALTPSPSVDTAPTNNRPWPKRKPNPAPVPHRWIVPPGVALMDFPFRHYGCSGRWAGAFIRRDEEARPLPVRGGRTQTMPADPRQRHAALDDMATQLQEMWQAPRFRRGEIMTGNHTIKCRECSETFRAQRADAVTCPTGGCRMKRSRRLRAERTAVPAVAVSV